MRYYILTKDKEVILSTLEDMDYYFKNIKEGCEHHIVKKEKVGEHEVSTVFIGIDLGYYKEGKPPLFETMIFSPDENINHYRVLSCTWKEAEESHDKIVKWVKDGCKNEPRNL